jgi:signal transduction histidine kinase
VERVRKSATEARTAREKRIREQGLPAEMEYVVRQIDREIERQLLPGETADPRLAKRLDELRSILLRNHEARFVPVPVAALFQEETASFRATVPGQAVVCEGPDSGARLRIPGDPDLVRWALRELFANVRAHGDGWSRVEIGIERRNDAVAIRMEDDGAGPDPTAVPRLYGAFTPRIGSKGPGLGLFAVRTIIERMGGSIHASPGKRGGLAHTVLLPLPAGGTEAESRGSGMA